MQLSDSYKGKSVDWTQFHARRQLSTPKLHAYQNKVTSKTTNSHVQFLTVTLFCFAKHNIVCVLWLLLWYMKHHSQVELGYGWDAQKKLSTTKLQCVCYQNEVTSKITMSNVKFVTDNLLYLAKHIISYMKLSIMIHQWKVKHNVLLPWCKFRISQK